MSAALIAALFFTVALLVTHVYFLLGSVPLLILKHDTPMDARFVRGFFNTYYWAATYTAGATAASLVLSGRPALAAGAAALALLAAVLRRTVIPKMDALRAQFQMSDTGSIPAFRRIHVAAILMNLAQLVLIVGSLIVTSLPESDARAVGDRDPADLNERRPWRLPPRSFTAAHRVLPGISNSNDLKSV